MLCASANMALSPATSRHPEDNPFMTHGLRKGSKQREKRPVSPVTPPSCHRHGRSSLSLMVVASSAQYKKWNVCNPQISHGIDNGGFPQGSDLFTSGTDTLSITDCPKQTIRYTEQPSVKSTNGSTEAVGTTGCLSSTGMWKNDSTIQ